ncbi:hypothetical protein RTBOTA2_006865 [Rhodotorula toruloides]|uniref:Uncharacterized protein n=1 Tax=Rhodotorula toruloides TaxID=5286 RepID=A0A2T0AC19_RHOTO|nr:hypothetical protein RTBOTA2_006865 [Rhodotorula toruloides]PRQ75533.1 hypothetical protein AAT19DRAFT_13590 [Rhodotorula toruloides]
MVDSGPSGAGAAAQDALTPPAQPAKPSLLLRRGKRSFLIALPSSYADALAETRRLFPKLDAERICLRREVDGLGWVGLTESGWETDAARMQDCKGGPIILEVGVEADSDAESEVEEGKPLKRIKQEEDAEPAARPAKRTRAEEPAWTLELSLDDDDTLPPSPTVILTIRTYGNAEPDMRIKARLTTRFSTIYDAVHMALALDRTKPSLLEYRGKDCLATDTVAHVGITADDGEVELLLHVEVLGANKVRWKAKV